MKSLLYPDFLKPGDMVALTAPSSPASETVLKNAVRSLEFLELVPVVYSSCHASLGYLSGSDRLRASDINSAFSSPEIKAVFCLRGGYGAMRILPLLDYEVIRKNPKLFIGYSDITCIHTALTQLCGFITLHGPMPSEDYSLLDNCCLDLLKRLLFGSDEFFKKYPLPSSGLSSIVPGKASGLLTGGNLSLLAATLGTPYEIDTRDKILFIEETGEASYRLDRMITSLDLAGKFSDCAGIILGEFTGCSENTSDPSPEETVSDIIMSYKKPTLCHLRAGHINPQLTLPLGAAVSIDATTSSKTSAPVLQLL